MASVLFLIIGMIVGGIVASVVWAVVGAGKKKKSNAERQEREQMMLAIGELLADADAIEAKFRSGQITRIRFARELSDKAGAVTRQLRTNMHMLEVFFVKYAEREVQEYLRMIDNPERRKSVAADAQFAAGDESCAGEETDATFEADDVLDSGTRVSPIAVTRSDRLPDLIGGSGHARGMPMPDSAPALPPETDIFHPVESGTDAGDDTFEIPGPPAAPAPAPEKHEPACEDSFEIPAVQVAEPEPEPEFEPAAEPVADSWSEQPLEDYEAGFAKFEEQAAELAKAVEQFAADSAHAEPVQADEDDVEEFTVSGFAEAPAEFEPQPVAQPRTAEDEEEELFDISSATRPVPPAPRAETIATGIPPADEQEFCTETISFDRTAIDMSAGPTYPYARPAIRPESAPAQAAAPPAPAAPALPEQQGITGDDVVDSIDNFFKLK